MRVILLFSAFFICYAAARPSDFCYATDDDPYMQFATKTAYHFVRGGKKPFQLVPHCEPIQIWMLSRHGARYPKKEIIPRFRGLPDFRDQIVINHEHRRSGRLCDADLNNLKLWNLDPNLTDESAHHLTPEGSQDTRLFASRLKSNFRQLLEANFGNMTSENYKFRSTYTERARSTMEAFMEGLFGSKTAVTPMESPRENDTLLRGYMNCSAWQESSRGPPLAGELIYFKRGPEMTRVIQNVSSRLGFQYDLSYDAIKTIYDVCRFEKSWSVAELSRWCALFTREELQILEYSEDLYYNYAAGNRRKINKLLGCYPLHDMFMHFKQLEHGNTTGQPKGIFYFAHTVTLLSLLTSMGVATESELLASNYREMANREFKTSQLSPFGGNLVAVFYRCNDYYAPNKVMFYLQEKPLQFKGCDMGLCDWEYLKSKWADVASTCSANLCSNDINGVSANRVWNIITLTIPTLLLVFDQWNRLKYDESV